MKTNLLLDKLMERAADRDLNPILLEFTLSHCHSLFYMKYERFYQSVGVHEEEASAFLNALDFSSFQEFTEFVRSETYRAEEDSLKGLDELSRVSQTVHGIVEYELNNLQSLMRNEEVHENIAKLAQDMIDSQGIVFIGMRIAAPLATYASMLFNKIGIEASAIDSLGMNATEVISKIDRSKPIIALGFSRYSKVTVILLRMLKEQGNKIIAITDFPTSPLAKLADYSIFLDVSSHDFTDSFAAPFSLLSILATYIVNEKKDAAFYHLAKFEESAAALEYFI